MVVSSQIAPAFWSHRHSKLVRPTGFYHTQCFSQAYLARAVLGSGVCQGDYVVKSHGSWAGSGATNGLDFSPGDDLHVPQTPQKAGCHWTLGSGTKARPPPEVAASPGAWGDPQEVQALILNTRAEIKKQKNKTVRIISKSITSHSWGRRELTLTCSGHSLAHEGSAHTHAAHIHKEMQFKHRKRQIDNTKDNT